MMEDYEAAVREHNGKPVRQTFNSSAHAKDTLRKVAVIDSRIAMRFQLVEYYMNRASSMSQAMRQIAVQPGMTVSTMEECVVKAVDFANEIKAEIEDLRKHRNRVVSIIDRLESDRFKQVLERRYLSIDRPTWEKIAEEMGMETDYVKHVHGWALEAFAKAQKSIDRRDIL